MRNCFILFVIVGLVFSCKKPPLNKKKYEAPVNKKSSSVSNSKNEKIVNECRKYIGVPYKFGGITTSGMDCSGLIYVAFQNLNFTIPRVSANQADFYKEVNLKEIEIGDLVYFKVFSSKINHTGIISQIISKNNVWFIHTSVSKGVVEDRLFSNYWKPKIVLITRPILN